MASLGIPLSLYPKLLKRSKEVFSPHFSPPFQDPITINGVNEDSTDDKNELVQRENLQWENIMMFRKWNRLQALNALSCRQND